MDLGDVKNLATVTMNGKDLGVVWHPPYRLEITSALQPGSNLLTVTVYDSWVNRLIGDQQPNREPSANPITYTDFTPYHADSPLQPSCLIGPVRVVSTSEQYNHARQRSDDMP